MQDAEIKLAKLAGKYDECGIIKPQGESIAFKKKEVTVASLVINLEASGGLRTPCYLLESSPCGPRHCPSHPPSPLSPTHRPCPPPHQLFYSMSKRCLSSVLCCV